MNQVNLIGNLVGNPELGTTNNGKQFSKFTVAVNTGKDETSFIPCIAWNETAKSIVTYCRKGSKVGITGRINQRTYDNSKGEKVSAIEVFIDRCDFLTKMEIEKPDEEIKGKNLEKLESDNDLPF